MMISQSIVDPILLAYLGYSFFIGFQRGFFTIIVSIFGTYGAFLLAWMFRDVASELMLQAFGVTSGLYPSLFFLMLWLFFYVVTYVVSKGLTGLFKLTGMNMVVRFVGGALNGLKALLILVALLTFVSNLGISVYHETQLSKKLVLFGSKLLTVYKNNVDENQVDVSPIQEQVKEVIMDDDFRYNLLER